MKTISLIAIIILTGCARLQPNGPYSGQSTQTTNLVGVVSTVTLDKVTFEADRLIKSSDDLMHRFLLWEYQNRDSLPEAATQWADYIRTNRDKWISSALTARDLYVILKSPENKTNLQSALDTLQTAVNSINKYLK